MNGYHIYIDGDIYVYIAKCVSEINCEWYIKLLVERCKVCTGDMNSARNTEFMCSMCCTCQ